MLVKIGNRIELHLRLGVKDLKRKMSKQSVCDRKLSQMWRVMKVSAGSSLFLDRDAREAEEFDP